jgi:hypothetical protein
MSIKCSSLFFFAFVFCFFLVLISNCYIYISFNFVFFFSIWLFFLGVCLGLICSSYCEMSIMPWGTRQVLCSLGKHYYY